MDWNAVRDGDGSAWPMEATRSNRYTREGKKAVENNLVCLSNAILNKTPEFGSPL